MDWEKVVVEVFKLRVVLTLVGGILAVGWIAYEALRRR